MPRASKWGATVIPASSAAAISAGHTASSGAPFSSILPGGNQLATIVPFANKTRTFRRGQEPTGPLVTGARCAAAAQRLCGSCAESR